METIIDNSFRTMRSVAMGQQLSSPDWGYLLSGPVPPLQPSDTTSLHVSILSCTTEDVSQSSLWNVQSTGTTRITSDTDFFTEVYVTSPAKNRACGYIKFDYIFKVPWFITFSVDKLFPVKLATSVIHLMGYFIKVVKYTYFFQHWEMKCYVTGCSLCPHALFLQARSHMATKITIQPDGDYSFKFP